MRILPGDFTDPQVIELLRIHLVGMYRNSPKDSVFALDLSGLQSPDLSFWTVWEGDTLLGCGALKELSGDSGELKSMRTHPDHLRRGAARRLLRHLLDLARARGYRRVSLETGSGEAFDAALALYRSVGFANGEAFGAYASTGFNQFLHLDLKSAERHAVQQTLEQAEVQRLSLADQQCFAESLLNPPPANEALIDAFARHSELGKE